MVDDDEAASPEVGERDRARPPQRLMVVVRGGGGGCRGGGGCGGAVTEEDPRAKGASLTTATEGSSAVTDWEQLLASPLCEEDRGGPPPLRQEDSGRLAPLREEDHWGVTLEERC